VLGWYFPLREFILADDDELDRLIPSRATHHALEQLLDILRDVESVFKRLQSESLTIVDAEAFFTDFSKCHFRHTLVTPDAEIVQCPEFEAAAIKVLTGTEANLTGTERTFLVLPDEELPERHRRSKQSIPKTMFLAAVARPRYDYHRKAMFDGKLGIWPLVEDYIAQRNSANRPAGTVLTRNIASIDRDVIKEFLLKEVTPTIKRKWPAQD
ncbi:hypothetical protein F442_00598, partial [Phytophthora nicotianae P10297]